MEKIPDSICNSNWDALLKVFHSIKSSDTKSLNELKETAIHTVLTERQKEGIIARCDNQINGTYGSSSVKPEKSFK